MQCHYQTHDNYTKYKSYFPRSKHFNTPILYIELSHELDHPKFEKESKNINKSKCTLISNIDNHKGNYNKS